MLPGSHCILHSPPSQQFGHLGNIVAADRDGDPGPEPRGLPHLPPPPAHQHCRPQVPGRQQPEDLLQHIRREPVNLVRFFPRTTGSHLLQTVKPSQCEKILTPPQCKLPQLLESVESQISILIII